MRAPLLNQFELFGAPEEKSYSAYGVKLPYWEENGKITQVALSDKLILPVTYQKGGHIYTDVPCYGRVDYRGKNAKTSFLSHLANLRRALGSALELNESIARDTEKQGERLREALGARFALEAENTRLREELAAAKRQTPRVAEPQKKQFCSKVLILRPELVQAMKDRGATAAEARNTALIIQQLSYLIGQGFGKVLGDGRPYIFGTYEELYAQYFLSWSSKRTVRRSFQVAEKLGAIDSKQPEGNISRRKYYALTPEAAILAASGKKVAKMAASSVQGENTTDVGGAAAQPDEKPVQLYAIAATTTDLSELVEKLKPFFPSHDVGLEMRGYRKWRNDHQRPITARGFVDWMLRAEPRLSAAKT
jgi:hypothetical protein